MPDVEHDHRRRVVENVKQHGQRSDNTEPNRVVPRFPEIERAASEP